ncbi:MAG: hypothetical protein GXX79_18580 [Actinomycetales bacterium]|nr:hypothetical protein [Actinomycetales bacterium]
MADNPTERVIEVVEDDAVLIGEFLGDLSRSPSQFGDAEFTWANADPSQLGGLLHTWLWVVVEAAPDLAASLDRVDLSEVDWAAVGAHLQALLQARTMPAALVPLTA